MHPGAVTGNERVCKTILDLGANINLRDKDGKTALMIAVVNGHQGMVQRLLEKNADLTIKNEVCKLHGFIYFFKHDSMGTDL